MSDIYRMNVYLCVQGNTGKYALMSIDCDNTIHYTAESAKSVSVKYTDYFLTSSDKKAKYFAVRDRLGEIRLETTDKVIKIQVDHPEDVIVYLNDECIEENLEREIKENDIVTVKLDKTEVLKVDWE